MALGIVVGLVDEGRIARRLGCAVIAGGGTSAGATLAAETLIQEGATSLLSFGLCGGLDPALRPGAIVIPRAVVGGGTWRCEARLVAALGGATADRLAGAHAAVTSAAAKQALFNQSGAVAVDLESAAVARIAVRCRLPFAVLRAVCDPAERDLPAAALAALTTVGDVSLTSVARSLLGNPRQLAGLLRLAADARAARRALIRRVRIMGSWAVAP